MAVVERGTRGECTVGVCSNSLYIERKEKKYRRRGRRRRMRTVVVAAKACMIVEG